MSSAAAAQPLGLHLYVRCLCVGLEYVISSTKTRLYTKVLQGPVAVMCDYRYSLALVFIFIIRVMSFLDYTIYVCIK